MRVDAQHHPVRPSDPILPQPARRATPALSLSTGPSKARLAPRTTSASLAAVGPPLPRQLIPAPVPVHAGSDAWPGERVARGSDTWVRFPTWLSPFRPPPGPPVSARTGPGHRMTRCTGPTRAVALRWWPCRPWWTRPTFRSSGGPVPSLSVSSTSTSAWSSPTSEPCQSVRSRSWSPPLLWQRRQSDRQLVRWPDTTAECDSAQRRVVRAARSLRLCTAP